MPRHLISSLSVLEGRSNSVDESLVVALQEDTELCGKSRGERTVTVK
ncbi:hypothetical protein L798_08921 [Zootermopsis nevadensis]|uniref:Uncharacterized protein n=1 Tax=Zootermopsis nevadensis TaxID=136037 RepID=A0A067R486_ZOONE|nr:hypothetical protein L798_08921 [Zootermopsis nevadensis]